MALSLSIVILAGLSLNKLFEKINIPGLLGMLLLGILIGPHGVNILSQDILNISSDLREIALIIILIRAGLGIKKETLKQVGIPAIKMSCIPGLVEGFIIAFAAHYIFDISLIEGGILGFIVAAVSPAVIVPSMLGFIEARKGEKKGIPTLILAGASIDDVFAITVFSSFLGIYGGEKVNIAMTIFRIPLSILLGIGIGMGASLILLRIFRKYSIRDTKKVLIILAISIFITRFETVVKNFVPIAGLLGVMTVGFILAEKNQGVAKRLSEKFNKIWVFAELLLFVLVGAQVNIYVALDAGLKGILLIIIGLIGRSIGVLISLARTNLNWQEKLFCIIAYIPKATVQAAVGAVPLAAGVESGELILALAVLAIIITAPIGAMGVRVAGERWLSS
ncbi:cation:proton antiporter [Irregularibacter muris]|uniref:Cation:proton antiporter n=1 Tax=Irregularibacter muris TaxID=1796619 RepID=A0AAE3KYP7_9FIRM|nr:cation:proton antiporter [Irregularibacter muris]MCR1897930.1 cation:proton antiporter [Irregularibacter muris]